MWSVDYDGNLAIDNCTIQYEAFGGSPEQEILENPDFTSYNITELTPYTDYTITITCSNKVGSTETLQVPGSPVRTRQSSRYSKQACCKYFTFKLT